MRSFSRLPIRGKTTGPACLDQPSNSLDISELFRGNFCYYFQLFGRKKHLVTHQKK
jgi:hypothetical protein